MSGADIQDAARSAVASAAERVREGDPQDAVGGVPVGLVASVTSTEQVAEVLRAATAHRLTVVPRGSGTKLSWGRAPERADVVLDTSGLDRVIEHAAGDLIVETETGVRLADLQKVLAENGQHLALDETVPGAGVGGTLATNASGPQRLLAGTARDLLIGITVVRADGVVAKAGGRVVKNVAGYDLGKLLIGSFGTLAVATRAFFRLHPLPEARRWVSVRVADAGQAHRAVHAAVHSQLVPTAVEVDRAPGETGAVSVLLAGRSGAVEQRADQLAELLAVQSSGQGSGQGSGQVTVADQPPPGWGVLPRNGSGPALLLKAAVVLSGVGDLLAALDDVGASVRGSAGAGVVHASLPLADPQDLPGRGAHRAAQTLQRLRAVAARHHGSVVVLDGPAELVAALDTWGPVPGIDLMRRVKDEFDPGRRLSPGRFVGGI